MAADLDAGARLAHAIGVVDDRGRQPQDTVLHGLEDLEVGRVARGVGGGQHVRSLRDRRRPVHRNRRHSASLHKIFA